MAESSRNLAYLGGLLQSVADRGRSLIGLKSAAQQQGGEFFALAEALLSGRGEASGVAIARRILQTYAGQSAGQRLATLIGLAERFGPDLAAVGAAAGKFAENPDVAQAAALHNASEPRRQELIRRLNLAPGGTNALVAMRAELLAHRADHEALAALDADFVHLLSSWFNRGFLVLRRIDWSTPANILEKIIRYEAVHEIAGWDDLRRRLDPPDRRLYAFFHPALIDEPLIFVEVALAGEMAAAIQPLLKSGRAPIAAGEAGAAIFYSISNAQTGLAGISFGNFLIKQVVEELRRELPRLRTFATLSPAPGFAAWLRNQRAAPASDLISAEARRALALMDHPGWSEKAAAREPVARALLPLAAHYFLHAKTASGRPLDPVARFHLGNGARLERLNPFGDLSPKGLAQSHGLMVNYLYELDQIERNHEALFTRGEIVASSAVRRLVKFKKNAPETPANLT